jgi:multicomponent Na+:H+ antiporter subunit B
MGMEAFINLVLLAFLAAAALGIASIRNLFAVAMLSGIFSLLCACIFVLLDAVDVAFTEAAVGAGITTVLFLATFALTSRVEKPTPRGRSLFALLIVTGVGFLLLHATPDMPDFGSAQAPAHQHPMYTHFVETSRTEIDIPNAVTSVLASYRGYDTLGEVTVIFTAGIGVIMLLGLGGRGPAGASRKESDDDA